MLVDGIGSPRIQEGDPLPPEDRRVPSDPDEIERIYRDHGPALLRFLARTASPETAQDLCQQVFSRLAGRVSSDTIVKPLAYLKRAGRNLIADGRAQASRMVPQFELATTLDEPAAPDHLAALEARDMLRRIEVALTRLKPRTREIFLAHRLDGYSYAEIAARTGLSVKAVEKHMSRAIAHLDRLSRLS